MEGKINYSRVSVLLFLAIELNNLSGLTKICSLTSDIHIAKEIIIRQQGKHLVSDVSVELDNILKYLNEHKIFTMGNRISVPYYGKKLVYKIVDIKAEESKKKQAETVDVNNLSKAFKDINLTTPLQK